MELLGAGEGAYEQGDAGRFTGDVRLGPGVGAPDGTGLAVVHFSAGARTHWHTHPGGQLLYVLSGQGRVRSRGGPGHVLTPGVMVSVAPGEWHWHGGGPGSPMAHLSVNVGGAPEWGEPVSDEDYLAGS